MIFKKHRSAEYWWRQFSRLHETQLEPGVTRTQSNKINKKAWVILEKYIDCLIEEAGK